VRTRTRVVLDTNILFLPVRNRFPLEAEIERLLPGAEPVVPASVVAELDRHITEEVPGAKAARALADRFPRLPSPGRGDDAIVRLATGRDLAVVTADRALRDRLVGLGIPVLVPRDRHHLELHPGRRPANR
jgi:rRNA-processing protein FCF1